MMATFQLLGTNISSSFCVCVCVRTAVGARFCKKELGGHFPKYLLHLTQSSRVLDGYPHFAPPYSGSWYCGSSLYLPETRHKCFKSQLNV